MIFFSALSELYSQDTSGWKEDNDHFVANGSKIFMDESIYDYYKDQGHARNDDGTPT